MELKPHLIFWEITQRCNLKCPYCRRNNLSDNVLTWEESLHVIDSITQDYQPLLIFSGGEPLLYPYIFQIASYAHQKGLRTALATNATLIDKILAKRIKSIGFQRVAVSLDGASPDTHDSLRGRGTYFKTKAGIEWLRAEGVALQINTTLFRKNFKQILSLYKLCLELEITALHIFAFVPVGCGITVPEQERLSAQDYETFLNEMATLSLKSKIEIKITCAPHYHRILLQRVPNYFERNGFTKGCLAGSGVCFISSQGEIYPCGYLALNAGNIFKESFKKIWTESKLFQTLRHKDYLKGKCGSCEYVDFCSGCRGRAYAKTGDYLEEEPNCVYQPLNVKS